MLPTARHTGESIALSIALCAFAPVAAPAQSVDRGEGPSSRSAPDTAAGLPNPFAAVETWRYPSGLIVYFANLPKAEQVFLRATLPVGSREDPEELEGLAHFVEHMLFTGPADVSNEEFMRQAEDRGGSWNGSTNRNRTDYWLELPAAEWRFGLEWFDDLLYGHRFTADEVEEERGAVILEGDLEPRTPTDYIGDWFADPDWANLPGFWERELGIPTERNSTLGSWESLHSATVTEIQAFYDRWYGPQNMTLVIFGPLDRAVVRAWVDEHYGTVERFGEESGSFHSGTPANRFRRMVSFSQRRGHGYQLEHVVPDIDRQDWLWATFLRGLLSEHLNDVLRFERRAAYGVSTGVFVYRGHMSVDVGGNFDPEQIVESRAFIDDFLDALRRDEVDPELFEALRRRAVAPLLLEHQSPDALARWVASDLYQHDVLGDEFPDPVTFARQAESADLAEWMTENLVRERTVMTLRRPRPFWQIVEMLATGLVVLLTFQLLRGMFVQPLDVRRIEYARKVKYGPAPVLLGFAGALLFLMLAVNAVFAIMQRLERMLVDPLDFYPVHVGWLFLFVALTTCLLMVVPASVPRKLLLLDDHWRVKYLSYRSRLFTYEGIRTVGLRSLWGALLDRGAWPCRVLSWNPFGNGVHVVVDRGSYYFRCRDNEEMVEELERRRAPAGELDGGTDEAPDGGPDATREASTPE